MYVAKRMGRWLACATLTVGPGPAAARQLEPAKGQAEDFFGSTNLYTFHLTIAPDQWAMMEQTDQFKDNAVRGLLDNAARSPRGPQREGPGPGGFGGPGGGPGGNPPRMDIEFKEGRAELEFDGKPLGAVAVRFKGNSSFNFARNSLKRSLKLDFNDLEKGRTFFGLAKLNLNNNAMDPSQLREALAYDIFRQGDVPAGRTAFAKVFITVPGKHDRACAGLYTVVEQVDERFLKARFGVKGGLLLKPERVPGLPFLGNEWSAYTNRVQPKTTATADDAGRFIEFVRFLNTADNARFEAAAGEFLDVDEFLRFLALQALLANLDSPLLTGHNYYLWLHPKTRRFVWIPWDLNEAFGGFNPAGSAEEQLNLSLDHPYTRVNRLAERLLENPRFRERYHATARGLLATNFTAARLFPVIDAMAATIRPALDGDPMVTQAQFDTALAGDGAVEAASPDNFGGNDFRRGGRRPGGMQRPRIPIKVFVTRRVESARQQLDGKRDGYVPREIFPGPNGPRPGGPPRGREDRGP